MGDWSMADIPDLSGKTFVVTGANGGLGSETTKGIASKGANVVMACRTEAKAKDAIARLSKDVDPELLEFAPLDLADLDSVETFAKWVEEHHPKIDGLINNAGVMALPFRKTKQGFEMQMGTNHFGHFALTGRLLPRLREADHARIVTVSSNVHQIGKIHFDDLDWEDGYSKWPAYGQSKLANLLFTYELQRRLDAAKLDIISVAAHPGYSNTDLQTSGPKMTGSKLGARIMGFASKVAGQDPASGALPTLYAATAPGVEGGAYFGPSKLELWGPPKRVESNARSHDEAVAKRLWEVSEQRTGVTYDFSPA
jgi:NAD(P)-dependent dehydrogenase (short-subunit alcohol dehydrogenase family)